MLNVLAEANAARMRTYRDAVFCRHQQHRDNLVDARESTTVDLAEINSLGLQQLLEHHSIVTMLAGRNAYRPNGFPYRGMAENVVGICWFFDPERIEFGKLVHPINR